MRTVSKFMLYPFVTAALIATSALGAVRFEYRELDSGHGKVEVVDIDNDGVNDVIKRGTGDEALVWYKFKKNRTFEKHILFKQKGFRGDRIQVVDIDSDGDLDLATGLQESNAYDVVWLENPIPAENPGKPNSWKIHKVGLQDGYMKDIAAADFDGDGSIDIVTRAHTKTAIYFQREPDKWDRKVLLQHESHEGMDVGDLDRDGDPDIVLNGFWFETPANAENGLYKKHVFDKKWFTPVDNSWRDNNAAIKVVDLNGDGLLDILISHSELPGYPISIYMAQSREDVHLDKWCQVKVAERFDFCQTLDAGDVDNDGDLDILAAKFERDHGSAKWRNKPPYPIVLFCNLKGNGLYWEQKEISDEGMYAGVLGDVGSDGDLDIVGPRTYWEGPIRLWENKASDTIRSLEKFTYIQIDRGRDKRYFGLALMDMTGDGYVDIAAGKWFYRNPGGDMAENWERIDIDGDIDALVALDVDCDEFGDLIAAKPNEQYWYEATDRNGESWRKVRIGSLPINDHRISTQYYGLGQIVPGDKPEIILAEYYIGIPDNPGEGDWPAVKYAAEGRGYAAGDIDADGLLDIVGSYSIKGKDEIVPGTRNTKWWSSRVCWWKNPGDGSGDWSRFDIGVATHADRFAVADINGDERLDVVVTEERYPGHVPNANCYWYEQPADLEARDWKRHLVTTQFSMNNLDVADMDRDGDPDIITCEHSMPFGSKPASGKERLQIWENDGKGGFMEREIDKGKESHLGAQVADLDGDGDLDIVSIAWRDYQNLHLWRNDN